MCKVNYSPSISSLKVWSEVAKSPGFEYEAGEHEPEICCENVQAIYNYDGMHGIINVLSSSNIRRIGVVRFDQAATAQDSNHIPIFEFMGGSTYNDTIAVIKMENMLEYNPI